MIPANLFMASSVASQSLYLSVINWAVASHITVIIKVEVFILLITISIKGSVNLIYFLRLSAPSVFVQI